MNVLRYLLFVGVFLGLWTPAEAYIVPGKKKKRVSKVELREKCKPPKAFADLSINNVRARLLTGGDLWWDGDGKARYVVPKVDPTSGEPEVSSIFAGSVWIGGFQGGNLKATALDYRTLGFSWFPGPLDDSTGTTDREVCERWDRFFEVLGKEVRAHISNYNKRKEEGTLPIPEDEIPDGVKYWPAKGNRFFEERYLFPIPEGKQGFGTFADVNGNFIYDPEYGDFPTIEIRGCALSQEQVPDQMFFYVYNDKGAESTRFEGAVAMQMEVQVQAFAYQTSDEVNDMTFYRHKLINRATQRIDSTYFAMWVDPDLGCYVDDYIGCDTTREIVLDTAGNFLGYRSRDLMFIYNSDEVDGNVGPECDQGVPTYGTNIPILGVDYFRGPKEFFFDSLGNPLDTFVELGMSSFMYYINTGSSPTPIPPMTDPDKITEVYNYMTGRWKDGTRLTLGGTGYDPNSTNYTRYAFPGWPNDPNGWSMCQEGTPPGDFRTIQASGPFILLPGVKNELIIGVVWVADQDYPCPSLDELIAADEKAQDLFDNCFDITDGPSAPNVDIIELDRELILVLTNDDPTLNNYKEQYRERILGAPPQMKDPFYYFEGYRIYQVAGPNVTRAELNDPEKAREIATFDIKNGVKKIYNWKAIPNPNKPSELVWVPELKVEGLDNGIRHTLRVTEDAFAESGAKRLINHKPYYFLVIAYAQNSELPFDPDSPLTTFETPYIEGRLNVGDENGFPYKGVPRPIIYQKLNAAYGDGPKIETYDGTGVNGQFLRIDQATEEKILNGTFDGIIGYEKGAGPIQVQIYDPLRCKDGVFWLYFYDSNNQDDVIDSDANWYMVSEDGDTIFSERTIERLNEQIIKKYGFAVSIAQTKEPGYSKEDNNGFIGVEYEYAQNKQQPWLFTVPNGFIYLFEFRGLNLQLRAFDFIQREEEYITRVDPAGAFSSAFGQGFVPYILCDPETSTALSVISPAWRHSTAGNLQRSAINSGKAFDNLNNVDIVLTPDKSKWSRCIVVETTTGQMVEFTGLQTVGRAVEFQLRQDPSVSKDADENGMPIPDNSGTVGMGWFPGYAIDVETGQRLNIFFGEASIYNNENFSDFLDTIKPQDGLLRGADMMFNPTDEMIFPELLFDFLLPPAVSFYAGGQHKIYVTNTPYDSCKSLVRYFERNRNRNIRRGVSQITWAAIAALQPGQKMLSYAEGLVPDEVRIRLRVNNPYAVHSLTGQNNGHNMYKITFEGVQARPIEEGEVPEALKEVRVVPNPYYGQSDYEGNPLENIVKITNLPERSTVTIYSLDGRFIRQYKRNFPKPPQGAVVGDKQFTPDLVWDLKNDKNIPISSGTYLIHIRDEDTGQERIIKWFGIMRKFDPSTLR